MPRIGNVDVSDDVIGSLVRASTPETPRPGVGEVFSAAAQGAYGQLRYGLPYQFHKLNGDLTPQDETYYKTNLVAADAAANQAAPAQVSDLTSGKVGIGRFISENLAASLPYMAGSLVGGVGGFALGGAPGAFAGAIAAGTPQFSASNVDRAVQEQGGLSKAAAERSLISAVPQSASDVLAERFLPGIGRLFGGGGGHAGGFLLRTLKSAGKAAGAEAVTEAGQQVGERYAAGIPLATPDAAAEYVNAAVTAFALGGTLGAMGGFKRSEALAKSPDQVTPEDMLGHIDGILNGTARVAPTQTTLPLEGGQAAPQQLPLVNQQPEPVETPASRLPQLPLEPALSTVPPETQLELGQRFTDNLTPMQLPGEHGVQISPQLEEALASVRRQPPTPPLSSQASSLAIATDQVPVVVQSTAAADEAQSARLFADAPLSDLNTAIKGKDVPSEVQLDAHREIANRYQEAVGDAPLTTDNFQTRLDELKDGLRGSFSQKLTADNPTELVNKIYTEVFENQNTASNVQRIAQRAGLLDENLQPTPKANQIEAQRLELSRLNEPAPAANAFVKLTPKEIEKQNTKERRARAVENDKAAENAPPPIFKIEGGRAVPINPELTPPSLTAPPAGAQVFGAEAVPPPGAQIFGQPETIPGAPPAAPATAATTPQTVDPEFSKEWRQLTQGKRSTDALNLKDIPANRQAAEAKVFQALATDTSDRDVSAVESLARKMGLITDDEHMDVTPKGRQAFLNTAEGLDETVKAAQQQGYTGKQASVFDRGVRAQLAGTSGDKFTNFEDLAAHEAGRVWAKQFIENPGVRTGAQTAAIQARLAARKNGVAVDRKAPGTRLELTPDQINQAAMNRLIDAANLRAVNDTDVAALRRMVRDGASPQEIGQALQQVQGGQTLFNEPPSVEPTLSPVGGRGQPIFKEMADAPAAPAKAEARAQSEVAVQTYKLRDLVEFARAEGGVTDARAQKLHDMLDEGKTAQVSRLLKDFDPDAQPKPRLGTPRELVDTGDHGVGVRDLELEQAITGKTFAESLDHVIATAPSRYYREIMRQTRGLMKQLEKVGYKFEMNIIRPGDPIPPRLNRQNIMGSTFVSSVPREATVWLKGADMGADHGVSYQVVAHEMLHAVSIAMMNSGPDPKGRVGAAVKDLRDLAQAISNHLDARAEQGNLTPFEQGFFDSQHNAFANADEIFAWALTNPEMQRYLQSIEYKPRQSVFSKLVDLLRNLLGLDGKYNTALTEMLRVSEQVLGTKARELTPVLVRDDPSAGDTAPAVANMEAGGASIANRTVEAANEATKGAGRMIEKVTENLNPDDFQVKARRGILGWISHNMLDRLYGKEMPGIVAHSDAHRTRAAVLGRFEHMGVEGYREAEKLPSEQGKRLSQLMKMATVFQLDPDKAFADHTHLENDPKAVRLKELHDEMVKIKNDMSRGDGAAIKVFNNMRQLNDAQNLARLTSELHSLVALDPELTLGVQGSGVNPMDTFMRSAVSTPTELRDHWNQALQQQLAAATAFVNLKKGEAATGTLGDQRAMAQHLSPIEDRISSTYTALAAMQRAPYFHIGRYGDNFGSAVIRTNVDGTVDADAQEKVADALEKAGFANAEISTDNTRPKIALRFDTVDQTNRFVAVMKELEGQGLITPETIKAGPRTRSDNFGVGANLPSFVQSWIQALETSPSFTPDPNATADERAALEKLKGDAIQLAKDSWIEHQPDSAISKVLAKRYTVPGYDPDMLRNFAHRWHVGSVSLASVAAQPKFNEAYTNMRAQVNDAQSADNTMDPHKLADILSEVSQRDARAPINPTADTFDKLRAFGHAYYLGFSPAYGLVNMTQVGVTALPELAKKNGYAKSFHALRRATPQALAIVKAATAEAVALGPKHYGDVAITDSVLKKAGLSEDTTNFVRHMLATGTIDIGSAARALGQLAERGGQGKLDTALKYASAVGLYTETISRLITALAAHDLHGGSVEESAKYASNVVSNSMFDYQNWNTARQLGKQGFAGPVTPLLTQFMSYSVQLTEKLFSEIRDASGRQREGESLEDARQRRSESQRFLAGHLTAITALAGTLGLPFATVFATALEKLVNSWKGDDEPPFDATASWRDFLASVIGKDAAEVVSRGLPRIAGFDLSQRAGEQSLLPFSDMISDKRGWREAIEDQAGRSIGASPNMLLNLADAGAQFGSGDVLGGLKSALPVAFKSPVEAYRMATEGYVDTKGSKLPLTPGAAAILTQLLGFTPQAKAEYSEARGDQNARKIQLNGKATKLRSGIVKALLSGDQERARELVTQAVEFDTANPTFAVIPSLSGAVARQVQSQSRARALNVPLGVSLQDIAGQRLTDYANLGNGQ